MKNSLLHDLPSAKRSSLWIPQPQKPSWDAALWAGKFYVECVDANGDPKWVTEADNGIVNVGVQYMLNLAVAKVGVAKSLFMGLIGTLSTGVAGTDTGGAANHAWSVFTGYNDAAKIQWNQVSHMSTISGTTRTIKNDLLAVSIPMSGAGTVTGIYISDNTLADLAGHTYLSAATFGTPPVVGASDTLNVTYEVGFGTF